VAIEAVGDKIRLNSQGWEDARVLNERQVFMVVAIKGQLFLLPEPRPAKFERIDHDGLNEADYGPATRANRSAVQQIPPNGRRVCDFVALR
jgi:hypothetical protein